MNDDNPSRRGATMIDRELPDTRPQSAGAGLRSPLQMACGAGPGCRRLASSGGPTDDRRSEAGKWGIPIDVPCGER